MRRGLRGGVILRTVHFLLRTEGKGRRKVYQDKAVVISEAGSEGKFEDESECHLHWKLAAMPRGAPPARGILEVRVLEGVPFPPPGDLPSPGIEPRLSCFAGRFFTV